MRDSTRNAVIDRVMRDPKLDPATLGKRLKEELEAAAAIEADRMEIIRGIQEASERHRATHRELQERKFALQGRCLHWEVKHCWGHGMPSYYHCCVCGADLEDKPK